jgi:hypothetical protein
MGQPEFPLGIEQKSSETAGFQALTLVFPMQNNQNFSPG